MKLSEMLRERARESYAIADRIIAETPTDEELPPRAFSLIKEGDDAMDLARKEVAEGN
jgi:hypothetical protein